MPVCVWRDSCYVFAAPDVLRECWPYAWVQCVVLQSGARADALPVVQPTRSPAVEAVTDDFTLDRPVTILVPTNAALDRNTARMLARDGNLQEVCLFPILSSLERLLHD